MRVTSQEISDSWSPYLWWPGWAPDGSQFTLAVAGEPETVVLTRPAAGVTSVLRGHTGGINAAAWSSYGGPGGTIATGAWDGTVRLWSATGEVLRVTELVPAGSVECVAFSAGGKHLASAGSDGSFKVTEVETGEIVIAQQFDGEAFCTAWRADGGAVAVTGEWGWSVIDLNTGEVHPFPRSQPGIAVSWHQRTDTLAVTCEDGTAWLLEEGEEPARLLQFDEPARGVAWHAAGLLAVGDAAGNLVVFDSRRRELWNAQHQGEVVALSWRPESHEPELLVGTRGRGAFKYRLSGRRGRGPVAGVSDMTYILQPMTQEQAEQIAHQWHYEGMYSFYDAEADAEDLQEFVDRDQRGDRYFAVLDGTGELVGFFSFSQIPDQAGDHVVEIGLGLRPDLTGKGNGLGFVRAGLEFARREYSPDAFTLSVATFNRRAIRVYEKAGFKPVRTFVQETNGGRYEFMELRRRL